MAGIRERGVGCAARASSTRRAYRRPVRGSAASSYAPAQAVHGSRSLSRLSGTIPPGREGRGADDQARLGRTSKWSIKLHRALRGATRRRLHAS